MNMQPRPEPKDGEDCFTLCVSSILAYQNVPEFCSVWKQCGIVYTEPKEGGQGRLSPIYMATENDLQWIHGIKLQIYRKNDKTAVVQHIKQLLIQGEPVIVWLDVFDMKYNSLYQLHHFAHCLLLVGYADERFEFIDEFYHLKDTIDEKTLINALDLRQTEMIEEGTHYVYNVVDSTQATIEVTEKDIHDVIQMNLNVMQSKYLHMITTDHGQPVSNAYTGLQALDRYIDHIHNCLSDITVLTDEYVEQMYQDLSRMSNNRYLFTYFLEQGISYDLSLKRLIEKYQYVAQRWKLVSNMALKSQYVEGEKRQQMVERIWSKLQSILQLEQELVEYNQLMIEKKDQKIEMEY
ncbi:BtrH N-terminal domain-containing protein [Paenibacillus sp. KACC 21273]|uniref:BtrH N-terminal domain-containing protein n=1 Tax=Paenibacillus sp. KACC 21273 TaxID=3025665 RepID=UPI002366D6E9|nr:BtrH N-terminal domain-containing protein [Paenibacillus sp. KACC 21273]WDF48891.1 BtrH N-terminal domain-containing protein [Paenibacillus sp. KACC 21273]